MLVIAVSMGVYFLYIDKTYKQIAEQFARELAVEAFLEDAQNAREQLDKVKAEYRSFPTDADRRLKVLLPDTIDPVRLIIDINSIAERRGLAIRSPVVTLGVANPDQPSEYLDHSIRFRVVSTYPIFRLFLRDIEQSLAIRDFGSLSIKSASPSSGDSAVVINPEFAVFDYEMELRTYSLQ